MPDLQPWPLRIGWNIHKAGDPERYVYFITSGVVCRFYTTARGETTGFAITGNEGVIGIAAFLSRGSIPSEAIVLSPGYSYRMRADRLQNEFEHDGPLPRLLLRYTQSLITQIGVMSACVRHYTLEQRLCRWILSCLDRTLTNELALTHDLIAAMLGVRREGVTEALGRLQRAGAIRSRRGHIVAIDRRALEAHACECYAVLRRENQELLADYRKSEAPSWPHDAAEHQLPPLHADRPSSRPIPAARGHANLPLSALPHRRECSGSA